MSLSLSLSCELKLHKFQAIVAKSHDAKLVILNLPGPPKVVGADKDCSCKFRSKSQNLIDLVDPCQTNNAVFALCKRFDISQHGADHSLIMKLMNPLILLTLYNCDIEMWFSLRFGIFYSCFIKWCHKGQMSSQDTLTIEDFPIYKPFTTFP